MALNKTDHDTFRHYLLGGLAGEDLEAFEKRLLTDDEVFEELLAAEDDLVDEYAGGQLSKNERDEFEKHFLSTPERQHDLDFARTLQQFIKQKTTQEKYWREVPASQAYLPRVAAAVLIISVIAALAYFYFRTPLRIIAITLAPTVITRSEAPRATEVNLREADLLEVFLRLPEGFTPAANYRAELQNELGKTKTVSVTSQDSQSVAVQIPANELTRGRYILKLIRIDADGTERSVSGSYLFIVND